MAVRRQPLAVLQDENAVINRGKITVTKSVGLKPQQPDLSDRITPFNITNKPKPRTALGDISNCVESFKVPDTAVKQKKAQGKNVKMGSNPRYGLTEEEKQKADGWAREGTEKVQFSGKDMEAYKEKIAEEEVNRRVAQALSYRSEIPYFLPRSLQKDSPVTTDILELDPVEDLCKKGYSPRDDMKLEDVDYDESFLECLEILQNASNKWPGIMEDCVY